MRCIFCKQDSASSRSVEHIIPESLGNTEHTLPPRVVCDKCNNYFARKVEKPFLESPLINALRFEQGIGNKQGRVPRAVGMIPQIGASVDVYRGPGAQLVDSIGSDDVGVIRALHALSGGTLIIPMAKSIEPPTGPVLSRFLAKVGMEVLALRCVESGLDTEELVEHTGLDPVRAHAREGRVQEWPTHIRRIYSAESLQRDPQGRWHQTLHEFDLLYTDTNELYVILALFGLELVLNLGGPELEGYHQWLAEHDGASPLYTGKNAPAVWGSTT